MHYEFKDKRYPEEWSDGKIRRFTPQELAYFSMHGRRLWMKLYYAEIDDEIRAYARRVDLEDWRRTDPVCFKRLLRIAREYHLHYKGWDSNLTPEENIKNKGLNDG